MYGFICTCGLKEGCSWLIFLREEKIDRGVPLPMLIVSRFVRQGIFNHYKCVFLLCFTANAGNCTKIHNVVILLRLCFIV